MTANYRRFEARDRTPAYRLFRDSIWHYMLQLGMVKPGETRELEETCRRQWGIYLHLEQTAAEDWVAEDEKLGLIGWARSIERGTHLQLTHFFVDPAAQGSGTGRRLLQQAFPVERGEQRSIIATTNPNALSLYLRQGVNFQSMGFCFIGRPGLRQAYNDLRIEQVDSNGETLRQLGAIDSAVIGFERSVDLEYYASQQPIYLGRRNGQVVGYAFGSDGKNSGPAAALDPQDLPALLQSIETSARAAGLGELSLMIPAVASAAVDWALASGYRIDPFYEVLLSSNPMKLDRYLVTESTFLW